MKRKGLIFVCLLMAIGITGLLTANGFRKSRSAGVPTDQKLVVPDADVRIKAANHMLSGPYMFSNLTIYLIHGQDRAGASPPLTLPLTLSEAMEQKKVIVHETQAVNELAIENISDEQVFIQSGDIVKGGQQDRVLALDMIIAPKSGRIPIGSFCVEHGRWSRRGDEAVAAFSSSNKMLSSKELKIAAKHNRSQSEVWDQVAQTQKKLSHGVLAASTPSLPADPLPASASGSPGTIGAGQATSFDFSISSMVSRSSLQLTLENDRLKDTLKDYIQKLSPIIEGKNDVIGFVFAINGVINSADVYASTRLFRKLWPKLLESSATEAISEFDKTKLNKPVETALVKAFLDQDGTGKTETSQVGSKMTLIKREAEKKLFFETRDGKNPADWIHRNYISK